MSEGPQHICQCHLFCILAEPSMLQSTEYSQLLKLYIRLRCLQLSPQPSLVWSWKLIVKRFCIRGSMTYYLSLSIKVSSRASFILAFSFFFQKPSYYQLQEHENNFQSLTNSILENSHFPFLDEALINPCGNSPSSAVFLRTKTKPPSWYIKVIGSSCSAARSLFKW